MAGFGASDSHDHHRGSEQGAVFEGEARLQDLEEEVFLAPRRGRRAHGLVTFWVEGVAGVAVGGGAGLGQLGVDLLKDGSVALVPGAVRIVGQGL